MLWKLKSHKTAMSNETVFPILYSRRSVESQEEPEDAEWW